MQPRIEARLRPAVEPSPCSAAVLDERIRQNISGFVRRSRSTEPSSRNYPWTPLRTADIFRAETGGLSFGVIVTEAAIDSGSLITARLAADQGREVFAVPGFVNEETSRGTHALIKEGATLVEQAQDVISVIAPQLEPAMRSRVSAAPLPHVPVENFGNHERLVYDALSYEPLTVDHLLERTRLPVPSVMASLLSLELRRRVRQLPGQRYLRM